VNVGQFFVIATTFCSSISRDCVNFGVLPIEPRFHHNLKSLSSREVTFDEVIFYDFREPWQNSRFHHVGFILLDGHLVFITQLIRSHIDDDPAVGGLEHLCGQLKGSELAHQAVIFRQVVLLRNRQRLVQGNDTTLREPDAVKLARNFVTLCPGKAGQAEPVMLL